VTTEPLRHVDATAGVDRHRTADGDVGPQDERLASHDPGHLDRTIGVADEGAPSDGRERQAAGGFGVRAGAAPRGRPDRRPAEVGQDWDGWGAGAVHAHPRRCTTRSASPHVGWVTPVLVGEGDSPTAHGADEPISMDGWVLARPHDGSSADGGQPAPSRRRDRG